MQTGVKMLASFEGGNLHLKGGEPNWNSHFFLSLCKYFAREREAEYGAEDHIAVFHPSRTVCRYLPVTGRLGELNMSLKSVGS